MARTSTSNLNEQNQILSNIDAFLTCIEKFPDNGCTTQSISTNPMEFLLELMFRLKKQDKLVDFLTKFIKKEIPLLEATIKGILLANIKKMTDCTLDPRIPDYMRENGITLDLGSIDMFQMLNESPLDQNRNQLYMELDTQNATSPYSFLRGKDFNTFLWYVIHKGKYPTPSVIKDFSGADSDLDNYFNAKITNDAQTIFQHVVLDNNEILDGQSFKQKTDLGTCHEISVATTVNGKSELFPVGESQIRTTYFVNRGHYFDFIKFHDTEKERDYDQDIPLCSLSYSGSVDNNEYTYYKKKVNIKILEKPFVHLLNGIVLILFDEKGQPDKHGHYTVKRVQDTETMKVKLGNGYCYYEIEKPSDYDSSNEQHFFIVIENNDTYKITSSSTTTLTADTYSDLVECNSLPFLHECYPNLTVYEFNYDYVMSLRLFDAKVIIAQLINTLCYTNLGNVTLSLSSNYHVLSEQITSIVKKMLESDDSEISDCYFSFSNEEIEDMLHKADLKKANLVPFGNTTTDTSENYQVLSELINEFAAETTLEGSTEILKRMINTIDATIADETVEENDKIILKYGIMKSFFMNLVAILVNSILTPKVLMIFLVNYQMYGGSTGQGIYSPQELLEAMINPIKSIVKEMRDLLIRELYNYLLVFLKELCVLVQQKVLLEQINNYRIIVKMMLEECLFKFGTSQRLNTSIVNVDYADIDNTEINKTEPKC